MPNVGPSPGFFGKLAGGLGAGFGAAARQGGRQLGGGVVGGGNPWGGLVGGAIRGLQQKRNTQRVRGIERGGGPPSPSMFGAPQMPQSPQMPQPPMGGMMSGADMMGSAMNTGIGGYGGGMEIPGGGIQAPAGTLGMGGASQGNLWDTYNRMRTPSMPGRMMGASF